MPFHLLLLLTENTTVKMMVQDLLKDHLEPPIQSLCGNFRVTSSLPRQQIDLIQKIWELKNQHHCHLQVYPSRSAVPQII